MYTDPIADFLTRLRNASHSRRTEVVTPHSKLLKSLAELLKAKRFIQDVTEEKSGKFPELRITLRTDRDPLELKRMSRPGQRIYVAQDEVRRVRNGLGMGVISTSRGILPDDEARKQKIGGEYLCEIY